MLPNKPRMADFAVWATAAEEALPWNYGSFQRAYEANQIEAVRVTLDSDPVATAVVKLLEVEGGEYTGTASKLWSKLFPGGTLYRDAKTPRSASQLSNRLRRLQAAFRHIGVEIEFCRLTDRNRTRQITVRSVRSVRTEIDDAPS